MLARYQIRRGQSIDALPARVRRGVRQDTRKHTRHCLRPTADLVTPFLAAPAAARAAAWTRFRRGYEQLLARRFAADRRPFDALAALARRQDVFLGCNCPTANNPDVHHCHTVVALAFLKARYPDLDVELPP